MYIDPQGLDEILLSGTYDEQLSLFENLQALTRDDLSYHISESEDWIVYINERSNGTKFDVGTNLIRELLGSDYQYLIMQDENKKNTKNL